MNGFFDIDTNPAKWGFMRSGTAIFKDAAIRPFDGSLVVSLRTSQDTLTGLAKLHAEHDRDIWDVISETSSAPARTDLNRRIYLSLSGKAETASRHKEGTPSPQLTWSVDDGQGVYMAAGGAGVLAGHASRFEQASDGYADISSPEYAVITATPLDGAPWPESSKILITACGRCENTGMKFSKCQVLGPDGVVKANVPVRVVDDANYVDLSPKHATMWYLLTRL